MRVHVRSLFLTRSAVCIRHLIAMYVVSVFMAQSLSLCIRLSIRITSKMSFVKKKLSGAQNRKRKSERNAAEKENTQPIKQFLQGMTL